MVAWYWYQKKNCIEIELRAVGCRCGPFRIEEDTVANDQRILAGVAHRCGIDEEKVISTVAIHANTSAASIPLAFAHGVKDGRIKKGDLLLLEAMGGGLTWGACVLRL